VWWRHRFELLHGFELWPFRLWSYVCNSVINVVVHCIQQRKLTQGKHYWLACGRSAFPIKTVCPVWYLHEFPQSFRTYIEILLQTKSWPLPLTFLQIQYATVTLTFDVMQAVRRYVCRTWCSYFKGKKAISTYDILSTVRSLRHFNVSRLAHVMWKTWHILRK